VLSFDLSKAIPPRAYVYVSAFMPGLFLEFSILLGNPDLARQLALRIQEGFGFGRYLTLFVGLFLAFIVGNAFMSLANLIQLIVGYAYSLYDFLWAAFEKHAILPYLTKLTHTQGRTRPKWVYDLYTRTFNNVEKRSSTGPTHAYLWWEKLAKQLLQKRYGLAEEGLPAASFSPLQKVLTVPTPEEIRGSLLVNASHATGWAALIASKFAPALRTKWYLTFAVFLIAYGLIHDWYVAKHLWDPDIGDIARLRAVLREFSKLQPGAPAQPTPAKPPDEGEDEH
jgi:hypothetical protein